MATIQSTTASSHTTHNTFSFDDPVLTWLRENSFGHGVMIETPYGLKKRRYFDYTASGQSFRPIEDLIQQRVLPYMTNTHAESSHGAELITQLYREAHTKVRNVLRTRPDDMVLYVGQGCTSAVNKLIGLLGIRIPDPLQSRYNLLKQIPPEERPVLLRTRMEHHSNDIPWRETIADFEFVPYDKQGRADASAIEKILSRPEYRDRAMKIGTFPAASNTTGVLNDVNALAAAMHDQGGVAFFDYAAGAPYLDIDVHPPEPNDRYRKDAVFISMHKFAGGPQAPGVLVCNKKLVRAESAVDPGGGTLLYSSPWNHKYSSNIEGREEGGTPQIVQAIRAGLAWDLKEIIGVDRMMALEHHCIERVVKAWRGHPKIRILGPDALETPRLGMMSMMIDSIAPEKPPEDAASMKDMPYLHYNMAVRMLSDIYGIQVRGGCMCAHTYSQDLLDINRPTADWVQAEMSAGNLWIKPGFMRVSFGPTVSKDDLDVLVDAIPDLADNWKKYAVDYSLDPLTADCRHKSDAKVKATLTLPGPSAKPPAS